MLDWFSATKSNPPATLSITDDAMSYDNEGYYNGQNYIVGSDAELAQMTQQRGMSPMLDWFSATKSNPPATLSIMDDAMSYDDTMSYHQNTLSDLAWSLGGPTSRSNDVFVNSFQSSNDVGGISLSAMSRGGRFVGGSNSFANRRRGTGLYAFGSSSFGNAGMGGASQGTGMGGAGFGGGAMKGSGGMASSSFGGGTMGGMSKGPGAMGG